MDLSKSILVVIVPIVVSILAATFGSVKYIINLTETIEENKQQVALLTKTFKSSSISTLKIKKSLQERCLMLMQELLK